MGRENNMGEEIEMRGLKELEDKKEREVEFGLDEGIL